MNTVIALLVSISAVFVDTTLATDNARNESPCELNFRNSFQMSENVTEDYVTMAQRRSRDAGCRQRCQTFYATRTAQCRSIGRTNKHIAAVCYSQAMAVYGACLAICR